MKHGAVVMSVTRLPSLCDRPGATPAGTQQGRLKGSEGRVGHISHALPLPSAAPAGQGLQTVWKSELSAGTEACVLSKKG